VLVGGSPMEMDPWLAGVPAVLLSWYSGMEGGQAIARILFGDVNPSGKLPCTFPKKLEDSPAHALRAYPGSGGVVKYEEGLLVGYRWFDARKIEPLFPFGHGLSYTTFEYSGLKTSSSKLARNGSITVSLDVRNTGKRAGDEVVQLYAQHLQSAVERPVKELKGFQRVSLKPGERKTVKIPLRTKSLAYWNEARHAFTVENGRINLMVGGSSADIQLRKTIEVK
jgi:beta-glucosidase